MLAGPMPGKSKNGKTVLRFLGKASNWSKSAAPVNGILLPCRQCIGCRLERSRQWAMRLMYEAGAHERACFLTLTYSDDRIPKDGTLVRSHITTFIKDLRARCDYYGKGKLKTFYCGEYGTKSGRPHYHLALYGPFSGSPLYDFGSEERVQEEPSRSGAPQWSHSDLSAVWPFGRHRFSELSFESAAYMARYILKKVTGVRSEAHYSSLGVVPEFQGQSHRLGRAHLEEWSEDIYPRDLIVLPGRGEFLPPPYYDRCLEKADRYLYEAVKAKRAEAREKLTSSEWFAEVERCDREGRVKQLVADATLKREGVL